MQTAFRSEERFTEEEFWEWLRERPSSDVNRYELIAGRIVMSPPAGWPHGTVGSRLNEILGRHVRSRGLGLVFDASTGFALPSGDTLEPDVAYVSTARWQAGPAPVRGRFLRVVPDLVGEVLSDPTADRDRTEKKELYARNGVAEYWLVDTDRREVTVLVRDGGVLGAERVFARGRVASPLLPGIVFEVEELFADLPSR